MVVGLLGDVGDAVEPPRSSVVGLASRTTRSSAASILVGMRIVSLVPSATELLFALGVGDEVTAVTHECDYPPEALELPKITRDLIGPGLPPDEIDRAVRELTEQGRSIYELDEHMLQSLAPELIVTQALCAVCAVSFDDVRAIAERMDPAPEVDLARPAHARRGAGRRPHAGAGDRREGRGRRPGRRTPRPGSTACGSRCATRRRSRSPRSSGSTRCSSPGTGRRS